MTTIITKTTTITVMITHIFISKSVLQYINANMVVQIPWIMHLFNNPHLYLPRDVCLNSEVKALNENRVLYQSYLLRILKKHISFDQDGGQPPKCKTYSIIRPTQITGYDQFLLHFLLCDLIGDDKSPFGLITLSQGQLIYASQEYEMSAMEFNYMASATCIGNYLALILSTPLCKSNGTFSWDIDINGLISFLWKYKTWVIKCYILTCCHANLVCLSLSIV